MQTPENVCRRAAVFVEGSQITLPILAINHPAFLLNGWNRVWPLALKLRTACPAEERGSVTTTSKPMFLLPARETWRSKRHFFDN
jgi:hypothetical protein